MLFIPRVVEILTSDFALFLFAVVGIAGTALSIARDTEAQRTNALREELRVEF